MLSQDSTYQGDRAYFATSQGGPFPQPYWSHGWVLDQWKPLDPLQKQTAKVAKTCYRWKREIKYQTQKKIKASTLPQEAWRRVRVTYLYWWCWSVQLEIPAGWKRHWGPLKQWGNAAHFWGAKWRETPFKQKEEMLKIIFP